MNLINFAFNPWSTYWKRNQTIVYLLSQTPQIHKVLFVNPAVWLTDLFRNPHHQLNQSNRHRWHAPLPRHVAPKISLYTPILFPYHYKLKRSAHITQKFTDWVLRPYVSDPYLLILNDPQPPTKCTVDRISSAATAVLFDYSDDFAEFSTNPAQRSRTQKIINHFLSISDAVITVNASLTQRALLLNSNVYTLPNATNYFAFENADQDLLVPSRLKKLRRPVLGYLGCMNSLRLDADLIEYRHGKLYSLAPKASGPHSERGFPGCRTCTYSLQYHILPSPPPSGILTYASFLTA